MADPRTGTADEEDREGLEHLCRYGLRAPFSQQRLSLREDGRVRYELPHPWPHAGGVTELLLEPEEFLRRLAALVPAPRSHQVRYHGVFGSRSKWRSRLPVPPPLPSQSEAESATDTLCEGSREEGADGESPPATASRRRQRLPWARLLLRGFFIDALTCEKCEVAMKVLAFFTDPEIVQKILRHVKLPDRPPPLTPARLPVDLFYPEDGGWTGEEVATVGEGMGGVCSWPAEPSSHRAGRDPPMGNELG